MPKYGPHIANIEKEVKDRLEKLGLTPDYEFDAKKHRERFYTAPCRDQKDRRFIFKMRTEEYTPTRDYFRREIKINQFFTEYAAKGGSLLVPKFIDGDSVHSPEWMVYEFIPGREAGDFYNGFENKHAKNFPLKSLIDGMGNMKSLGGLVQAKVRLGAQTYADYRKALSDGVPILEPFFSTGEIAQAQEILRQGKTLLDAKSAVIAHGDFHPGNIIITGRKVAIIDWYYVHLNNVAYDFAFLLLEMPDPALRKKYAERFVAQAASREKYFPELLRLCLLRLAVQKIGVLKDALYAKEPRRGDYYALLTDKGIAKLELNLEAFSTALEGRDFI